MKALFSEPLPYKDYSSQIFTPQYSAVKSALLIPLYSFNASETPTEQGLFTSRRNYRVFKVLPEVKKSSR